MREAEATQRYANNCFVNPQRSLVRTSGLGLCACVPLNCTRQTKASFGLLQQGVETRVLVWLAQIGLCLCCALRERRPFTVACQAGPTDVSLGQTRRCESVTMQSCEFAREERRHGQ